MTEDEEQKQLIQWCRTDPKWQYLFHIPNESVGGKGWLIRNRQLGVKSGVPDLFYPVPIGSYHGLFIEMKRPGGRLDGIQRRWMTALNDLGYLAICCKGWEEAKDALQGYMETAHSAG